MSMLDLRTRNYLRIALRIADEGKDSTFWFNKATDHWQSINGVVDLPDSVLAEVWQITCEEFPNLCANVRFRSWCNVLD